jgi:hypothetical protein
MNKLPRAAPRRRVVHKQTTRANLYIYIYFKILHCYYISPSCRSPLFVCLFDYLRNEKIVLCRKLNRSPKNRLKRSRQRRRRSSPFLQGLLVTTRPSTSKIQLMLLQTARTTSRERIVEGAEPREVACAVCDDPSFPVCVCILAEEEGEEDYYYYYLPNSLQQQQKQKQRQQTSFYHSPITYIYPQLRFFFFLRTDLSFAKKATRQQIIAGKL